MKLLHIDSSISGDHSVSRQLTAGIVARLRETTPGLDVTYRDLAATPLPHRSEAVHAYYVRLMQAVAAPAGDVGQTIADAEDEAGAGVTGADLRQEIAAANAVLDQFLAADIIVVGAPMYNFGIPSQLKTWIDCVAAPGKTFRYSATGVEGLAGGKRLIIASSRGGLYSGSSPMAALDHQESYLTSFFGFIGITDIELVRAEGVGLGPEHRQRALQSALAEATGLRVA
jgi:FMN-dependent NADH-azoreductase